MPAKPADRKPKKDSHKEPFHFVHDGVEYEIPSLARVKMGIIEDAASEPTPAQQAFVVIREIADDETRAAIRDMEQDEYAEFTTAWTKHSGVSLGESKG